MSDAISPSAQPAPEGPTAADLPPFRSVHTANFTGLLRSLGISLAVSTYQAGRLVVLRAEGQPLMLFSAFPVIL